MMPAEPRMGHYSNYQQYPPTFEQWQQPQGMPAQTQAEPNRNPSSRRSTISNPSDHERSSRPSTSDNKTKAGKDLVKIEPSPQEEDEDEADEKIDHRKRKRNRTIRSCVPCHNHKRKASLARSRGVTSADDCSVIASVHVGDVRHWVWYVNNDSSASW